MTDTVTLFAELFRGRTDAYGTNAGGVEHVPVTIAHYGVHLKGECPIGIFPILDDNTVWFGAIDLDRPDFELAQKMQTLIPGASWVERSRSGNAHIWVFFDSPAPAWAVRVVLSGATQAVGHPEVEVFPKQDMLKPGMVGNYINLPLFGDKRPILVASGAMSPTPSTAVELMYKHRQDPAAWERRARALGGVPPAERERTSEWGTQPNPHICAGYIIKGRFDRPLQAGHRHVVLFNLAVQLLNWRECSEHEAWNWVQLVNLDSPRPIPPSELERLFENARDGQWTRTGCDDPVMFPYVHPDCPIAHAKVRE